jgi:hypothetical protein
MDVVVEQTGDVARGVTMSRAQPLRQKPLVEIQKLSSHDAPGATLWSSL